MNLAKLVPISIASLFIYACSHPIEIVGEGDVTSASGDRNCTLADFQAGLEQCTKNVVVYAYQETYTPVAHSGWKFDHWENYCSSAVPPNYSCSFNYTAQQVKKVWFKTMPPLKAVFTSTAPPTPILSQDIVSVDDKEWAQPDLFRNLTWDQINAVCPGGPCVDGGNLNGKDVSGWTWASVDDVNVLINNYIAPLALGSGPSALNLSSGQLHLSFFQSWRSTHASSNLVYGFVKESCPQDPNCGAGARTGRISQSEVATTYTEPYHFVNDPELGAFLWR